MRGHRSRIVITALAASMLIGTVFVSAASADNGREVHKRGVCSAGATWKLEAEDEGARLEMEFDVNALKAGIRWRVKLRHDGTVFEKVIRTTNHEGNFEVERMVTDRVGTDMLGAHAVNLVTGQVCDGHVSI